VRLILNGGRIAKEYSLWGESMKVKIDKNNKLVIEHKLKRNETYKINSKGKFITVSIYKKPQILKGVASYCADGKHVVFLDYDNVPLWLVEQDFSIIQEEFNLPPSYLFTTGQKKQNGEVFGNYHIICLAKFKPAEVYNIVSSTHCDINFMSMPQRNKYRNWILRTSDKKNKGRPTFLGLIGKDKYLNTEASLAHLIFLKKLYPLPEVDYKNLDKNKSIFTQVYEAS
jgi:hypothetical protein